MFFILLAYGKNNTEEVNHFTIPACTFREDALVLAFTASLFFPPDNVLYSALTVLWICLNCNNWKVFADLLNSLERQSNYYDTLSLKPQ